MFIVEANKVKLPVASLYSLVAVYEFAVRLNDPI